MRKTFDIVNSNSIVVKDAVIILCGGSSTRMGQDKATLIYNEKSFLEHAVSKAVELSKAVFISVKTKQQEIFYTTLLSKFRNFNEFSIQFLIDEFDFDGPLNGVCTAVKYAIANRLDYVQFLPIDIPLLLTTDLIQLRTLSQINKIAISSFIAEDSFITALLFHIDVVGYKKTWQLLLNSVNNLLTNRVTAFFRIAPNLLLLKIPDDLSTRFNNINTQSDYQQLLNKDFVEVIFIPSQLTNSPSIFRKQIEQGVSLELLQAELTGCTIPHLQRNIRHDLTLLD